jgi:hypothetical protein
MLALVYLEGEMSWTKRLVPVAASALLVALTFACRKVRLVVGRTENWPEAEGQVVSTNLIDHNHEGASAEIAYLSSVRGISYGGHVQRRFIDLNRASNFADGCKEMKS